MKPIEQHPLPPAASRQLFRQRGHQGAVFAGVGESHRKAGAVLQALLPHHFGRATGRLWQGLQGSVPASLRLRRQFWPLDIFVVNSETT